MRIACVDKTAADRLALEQFFDAAFERCRNSIGHLTVGRCYPASREEVLLNSAPDIVAIGPQLSVEEVQTFATEFRKSFPTAAIFVILKQENYSLRALKRLEAVSAEVFSVDDSPVRIIHAVSVVETTKSNASLGKIVTIHGVKGGVGSTTITAALAHAAQALGKKPLVLDLSLSGSLAHYLNADKSQSADYAALLIDFLYPDDQLAKRLITTAPNGIDLVMQPAGGTDVREYWLRDQRRFELTLNLLEYYQSVYDVVLIDTSRIEGVLYFALTTRADVRLLVTSNEAASVHLLSTALTTVADYPGQGKIKIIMNMLQERGLTRDDILDFLFVNDAFEEQMTSVGTLPFDLKSRNWIGTGNTFYTEASKHTQDLLERALADLIELKLDRPSLAENAVKKFDFSKLIPGIWKKERMERKGLPLPQAKLPASTETLVGASNNKIKQLHPILMPLGESIQVEHVSNHGQRAFVKVPEAAQLTAQVAAEVTTENSVAPTLDNLADLYQAPEIQEVSEIIGNVAGGAK